ncbi:aldehyde dehydrogenase family protein [Pseudonocardia sp. Cha107L01]|uniref:aldehyde dehydrogenase family protein n=1 Tax=Pseudonocardia sp. Cha107L01 TaxID=3457576 RepID=UPI00403EBF24
MTAAWTPRVQARTFDEVTAAIRRSRAAAGELRVADRAERDRALLAVADALETRMPRLPADQHTHEAFAAELRDWAGTADPLGPILREEQRRDGARLRQLRVPIGVIAVLFDDAPHHMLRLLGPLLKTGNAVLLRAARHHHAATETLVDVVRGALATTRVPPDAVQLISSEQRSSLRYLITARGDVDLLIPLVGPGLRATIIPEATVPLIEVAPSKGHLYLDATADPQLAEDIVLHCQTQPTGSGLTIDTVLVHPDIAAELLPRLGTALRRADIQVRGDKAARTVMPDWGQVEDGDWATIHQQGQLLVAVTPGLDAAIAHIEHNGSGHTEVIITDDGQHAREFCSRVDAATVLVNTAPATDTPQHRSLVYSTQRLAPRGPLGPTELTTTKWITNLDRDIPHG